MAPSDVLKAIDERFSAGAAKYENFRNWTEAMVQLNDQIALLAEEHVPPDVGDPRTHPARVAMCLAAIAMRAVVDLVTDPLDIARTE